MICGISFLGTSNTIWNVELMSGEKGPPVNHEKGCDF
jgi:hypothetical protein